MKAGALYAIDWDYADLGRYAGRSRCGRAPSGTRAARAAARAARARASS